MQLAKKILLVFAAGLAGGCVATSGGTQVAGVDGEVIERSRESPPSWAGLRPYVLHDQQISFGYIHIESRHPDLPLGIKRTQFNALANGKDVFKKNLMSTVSRAAEKIKVPVETVQVNIGPIIEKAVESIWPENARVADIFFEKFRPADIKSDGLSEFYNIYVMIDVPKHAMTSSLKQVTDGMKASRNPDLQRVGHALTSRLSYGPIPGTPLVYE